MAGVDFAWNFPRKTTGLRLDCNYMFSGEESPLVTFLSPD